MEREGVVTHNGQFALVDQSTGEWRMLTHRGSIRGKTYPSGPKLYGLRVGERYRFSCAEVPGTDPYWRNQKVLYLERIETA